ncbi:MAG: hypothetical protein K6F46_10680 [Desulfovibrio sp.]|nr:hypothetical protein [Desulfovibrio sp.]
MEIDTQQMEALLRLQSLQAEQAARKPQGGSAEAFGSALSEALSGAGTVQGPADGVNPLTAGAAQAGMISQMLLGATGQSQASDPESQLLQDAFDQASGTLDLWDQYANALSSTAAGGNLRQAYSLLEGIGDKVAQLKSDTAGLRGKNTEFDSLINELDVITATEKFKFNRGDYA